MLEGALDGWWKQFNQLQNKVVGEAEVVGDEAENTEEKDNGIT